MASKVRYEIVRRKADRIDYETYGCYWRWLVMIDGEVRFRMGSRAEAESFVDWHRRKYGN